MKRFFLISLIASGCTSAVVSNEGVMSSESGVTVSDATPTVAAIADPTTASSESSASVEKREMSESEVLDRYSIVELESVSNALKTIADQSRAAGSDEQGEAIIGCAMTGQQARNMYLATRALIEKQIRVEAENYVTDPIVFAKDRGFETCAANCSCGTLAMVLERANTREIRKTSVKMHDRYLVRLQSKAALLGPEASLSCARRQRWFCNSDLRTFLEAKIR